MDNLEKQLARALQPKDPPADFTAKVMARVTARKAPHRWWEFIMMPAQRAALAGGLAGLMLIGGAGVAYQQHQTNERRRAEAARGQLLLALRVTGTQLNRVSRVLVTAAEEKQ